jgi:hypothetical protein
VSPRIAAIHRAVEEREHCRAKHVESLPISERHGGETIWEGVVETFDLEGHPKATRAYAWRRLDDGAKETDAQYTVVLGVPPINSARDAVKAALVAFWKQV